MSSPVVSIIVPTYRHRKFLPARINSILAQTFKDIELIVLDDASNDGTAEWLREQTFPVPTQCIINETRIGSSIEQWDRGIRMARGTFIWIAEGDDLAHPSFLSTLLSVYHENPKLGVVFCESLVVNGNGRKVDSHRRVSEGSWTSCAIVEGKDAISQALAVRNTIPNVSACLFRRWVFQTTSWKHPQLLLCGDWFAYVQILQSASICYIKTPLNFHRRHAGSVRASMGRNWKAIEESYIVLKWVHESTPKAYAMLEPARDSQLDAFLYLLDVLLTFGQRPPPETLRAALAFDPDFVKRLAANRPGTLKVKDYSDSPYDSIARIKPLRNVKEDEETLSFRLPNGLYIVVGFGSEPTRCLSPDSVRIVGVKATWIFSSGEGTYLYSPDDVFIEVTIPLMTFRRSSNFLFVKPAHAALNECLRPEYVHATRRRRRRAVRLLAFYLDSKIGHRVHYVFWKFRNLWRGPRA